MRPFTVFFAVCLAAQAQCTLRTLAGSPTSAAGDGGAATEAQFFRLDDVDRGADGALYVGAGRRIRLISPDGIVSTIAGGGAAPPFDGVPATEAYILPAVARLGPDGTVYFLDYGPAVPLIRRITSEGAIQTVPGTEDARGFSFDQEGNLWFSGWSGAIKRMNAAGTVTLLTSSEASTRLPVEGVIPLSETHFHYPSDLQHSANGNLYVQDGAGIYEIDPRFNVRLVLGQGSGPVQNLAEGVPATRVALSSFRYVIGESGRIIFLANGSLWEARDGTIYSRPGPQSVLAGTAGLSLADAGSLYLIASDQIFQLDSEGGIQTIAGRVPDYDVLRLPRSLAFDSAGNLFFADYGNRRVRKITPGGEITTVYEVLPERPNVSARPIEYLAMGPSGSLFLLDTDRRQVVEIAVDGQVTQTAGPPALDLSGLGADNQGNLYIRDRITNRVWQRNRTESWSSPMILRSWGANVASMALVFDSGDQLYAWIDSFFEPGYYKGSLAAGTMVDFRPDVSALAPASGGNVYVADRQSRVWKLSPESEPQLIAADSTPRAKGEDGIAIATGCIRAMTLDPAGNLVFSDTCRNRIRMLEGPGDCAPLPAP